MPKIKKQKSVFIKNFPIKEIKNPWGGEERTKLEVQKALRNLSDNPKSFHCQKCKKLFQPKPGQWIFYDLCDDCFKDFDTQKMLGRQATITKQIGYVHHFEDVVEWILKGEN